MSPTFDRGRSDEDGIDTVTTLDGERLSELRAEAAAPLTIVTDWGAATSVGSVRASNEDAYDAATPTLFVVADGMGGHPGGDVAARTAVAGVMSSAQRPVASWLDVMRRVNDQVRMTCAARGFDRAGTAIVVAEARGGLVTILHVGDCRAYRLRGGEIHLLTRDHSVQEELLASGADLTKLRPKRAVLQALTRYVGAADGRAVPDVTSLAPVIGDRLLLCTDGVYRQVDERALVDVMADRRSADAARAIVERADQAGGVDNATALVLDFGAMADVRNARS